MTIHKPHPLLMPMFRRHRLSRRAAHPVRASLLVAVAATAWLAVSCVSLEKGYPERRFFVLDAVAAGDAGDASSGTESSGDDDAMDDPGIPGGIEPTAASEAVLKVRRFSISETFASQEFAYRTGDTEYETDYYNTFLIPPAAQVTDQARQVMRHTNIFAQVVDDASFLEPTHLLEGHVVRLFADFRDREAPHAVLEMQLFLVELRGADAAVRVQKSYRQRVPIEVGDYSDETLGNGIVSGWNVALRRILGDFSDEIRRSGIDID